MAGDGSDSGGGDWRGADAGGRVEDEEAFPDELKTLLEKKEIFFLDVREPKELEETGTIKGYTNIPIGQLESRYQEVPKDRLIVTACAHGVRAGRAAEILEKHGYKIAGACGLVDWKEKGYPLIYPKEGAKK